MSPLTLSVGQERRTDAIFQPRFAEYQRLMEPWRATLPVPVLDVAGEDAVADLEAVARRLVAWYGLEWEPASTRPPGGP
jgi:hypothetical protein